MKRKSWPILIIVAGIAVSICISVFFYFRMLKSRQWYFDDLSEALQVPSQVEVLILRNQNLKTFPTDVLSFKNLRVLNLGNNELQELPLDIDRLTNLEELNMFNNQLEALPASISKLNNLKTINLGKNRFSGIPSVVCNLDSLNVLIMSDNLIGEVRFSGKLPNLKVIDFADNQISLVSEDIAQLETIEKIDLNNNRLSHIPAQIFAMPYLLEIILRGNDLDVQTLELYGNFNLRHTGIVK